MNKRRRRKAKARRARRPGPWTITVRFDEDFVNAAVVGAVVAELFATVDAIPVAVLYGRPAPLTVPITRAPVRLTPPRATET